MRGKHDYAIRLIEEEKDRLTKELIDLVMANMEIREKVILFESLLLAKRELEISLEKLNDENIGWVVIDGQAIRQRLKND